MVLRKKWRVNSGEWRVENQGPTHTTTNRMVWFGADTFKFKSEVTGVEAEAGVEFAAAVGGEGDGATVEVAD